MMMSETEQKHSFKDTFVQQVLQQVSQQVLQQVSQQMTQERQVPGVQQMIQQTQVQEIPQTVVQHVSSGNQPYLQTSLQTQPLTFEEEEQEQALRYIPSSQSTIQPEMLLETVQTGEMVKNRTNRTNVTKI